MKTLEGSLVKKNKNTLHPLFHLLNFQFEKPGRRPDFNYPEMAKEAVTKALNDARISYTDIQEAAVGFCFGKK
jgi:hypothetical protein